MTVKTICAQAAFIAQILPSAPYAATITTGIGNSAGCTPKFFLIVITSVSYIFKCRAYRRIAAPHFDNFFECVLSFKDGNKHLSNIRDLEYQFKSGVTISIEK